VRLVFVTPADLELASARGATWSARVLALAGVPSVAEAAALAACGPKAKLILPRIVVGPVACALASAEEAP
jgi:cobalt-precorrin 5A hydrolase